MRTRERPDLVESINSDVLSLRGHSTDARTDHYASDAMKSCFRYFWLEWHNTPATNLREDLGTFPTGLAIEQVMVNRVKEAGRFVASQYRMMIPRRPIPIKGYIDLIMVDELKRPTRPTWDKAVPVEIKSVKDWGERQGWGLWKKFLPKDEHVAQMMLYLHRLIERGLIKKDYGYVWYVNKNRNYEEALYQVHYDANYVQEIFEWYTDLERILFQEKVPPIPKGFAPDKYPCGWGSKARDKEGLVGNCKFHKGCWIEDLWGGGRKLEGN